MLKLVDEAEQVIDDKKVTSMIWQLLDHTWKLKRQTGSAVTTYSIDELYQKGI